MGSVPVLIWSADKGRLTPLYDAEDAGRIPINLNPVSATVPLIYPFGMVLGEVLASQGLFSYLGADGFTSDGTQNPKGLLEYRSAVLGTPGSAGSLSGVSLGVGGEWPGVTSLQASMFKSGDFDLAQIVGLGDSVESPTGLANLATMAGRLVSGALGSNEIDVLGVSGAASGTFGLTIPAVTVNGYTYPAITLVNTTFSATQTSANLVTVVNAALAAAGIPAWISNHGSNNGPAGTHDITIQWHGAYGQRPIPLTGDFSLLVSAAGTITRTNGVVNKGIVRFG